MGLRYFGIQLPDRLYSRTQNTCVLSRTTVSEPSSLISEEELEVPDKTLEVNFLNSNAINPKDYIKYMWGEQTFL